jgi:molybdopterin synthase catalytic subunit
MRVTCLYFASLRELAGLASEPVELPAGATVADALAFLRTRHPALPPMTGAFRCARNQTFAQAAERLSDGDELALLPPVSGG